MIFRKKELLCLITLFAFCLFNLTSCVKDVKCDCATNSVTVDSIPKGTNVKYELVFDTASGNSFYFYDMYESRVALNTNVTNWTYSFQTYKTNQLIYILATSAYNKSVTGRLTINGIKVKESKGYQVIITYP